MKKTLIILLALLLVGCNEETNIDDKQNYVFNFSDVETNENYGETKMLILADEDIYIDKAGVYELSGKLLGKIIIDVAQDVRLVLNNVDIYSHDDACIYAKNTNNLIITLKENSINNLSDGSNYNSNDKDVDSVIYCNNNLIINGTGALNINGNYKNAIVSKGDLTIYNPTINIVCPNKAIMGESSVKIKNSDISIDCASDGIRSKNEETGFIYLDNSSIDIETKANAIKAYSLIQIESGFLNIIESKEGLEAKDITINNGDISIKASDDAINCSLQDANDKEIKNNKQLKEYYEKIERLECLININGGSIHIDADGDGLDSNGSISINGGNVFIEGPTSGKDCGLDYVVRCESNGGSIFVSGMAEQIQEFSSSSKQYGVTYIFDKTYKKDSHVLIKNEEEVLFDYVVGKQFDALQFSNEKMKKNEAITITINDDIYELN